MKKDNKKNIIYTILIIVLVIISIILSNGSYKLKKYQSIKYKETVATSYRVYLNDSSYYNTSYLEEGMQYISNIIDYVDVTFSYINNLEDNLLYDISTKAEAIITIVDPDNKNKVIYKSTDVIEDTKKDSNKIAIIIKIFLFFFIFSPLIKI